MQSVRQYHQFARAVKRQYERDREKLKAQKPQHPSSPEKRADDLAPPSSSPNDSFGEMVGSNDDPEKQSLQDDRPHFLPLGCYEVNRSDLRSRPADFELTRNTSTFSHPSRMAGLERPNHVATNELSRQASASLSPQPTALGQTMTGVNVRERTTNEGDKGERVFIVGYEGPDDPLNPHNWPIWPRVLATILIAGIGFVVGVASSIDSSILMHAAKEFGVSEVAESLATGLYLIGFGAGALFAGPVSETLGRNPVYISTLTLYMIFVMASGLAPNLGAQLAFRFLAGFFGSTPLTCAGGSISDLWNPMERVMAFPVFANAAFTGPVLGPVAGGYIAQSYSRGGLDWRWTEWVTLIISGFVLILVVLFQPETYPQILLTWRAKHLREITGDDRFRAETEVRSEAFLTRLKRALYRPFLLTFREPIVILFTLYLTVIYIILFTFLDGYNYIFAQIHKTGEGITGLCFVGIAIGLFLASALVPLIFTWAKRDLKKIQESGGHQLPPEFRLWFSILGGALALPISLFWMGWTSYPDISIWSPLAASVLFGYGTLCVFISSYQYIIDSYESYSASALASVTLIRYCAAGGMTAAGIPFYENLGVHWTLTILGCIAAVMTPWPYLCYRYGPWIRKHSKYAISVDTGH